jgi:DDE superfamily endonuclease
MELKSEHVWCRRCDANLIAWAIKPRLGRSNSCNARYGEPTCLPLARPLLDASCILITLFRPATGEVRAKGVTSVTNAVLHPWLKEQLLALLGVQEKEKAAEGEVAPKPRPAELAQAQQWETWVGWPLNDSCPPLRMIVVWDNLAGHRSDEMVQWLFHHGIMPLYTPLSGSWLNMAESMQRILVRRALSGQYPQSAEQIIEWLEQTVAGTRTPLRSCGMASDTRADSAHGSNS